MKEQRCGRGTSTCNAHSRGSTRLMAALVVASLQLSDAQDLSKCAATVDYTASLGPGGVNNDSRTFGGSVGIVNLSKETIKTFKMGWNFTDGEQIASPQDIAAFDGSLEPVTVANNRVVLRTKQNSTIPILPDGGQHRFAFTGTKAPTAQNSPKPDNNFMVAPPDGMALNNLVCKLEAGANLGGQAPVAGGGGPLAEAVPARPNPGNFPTSSLYVQYAPIEYITLPLGKFATSFTQFLVRIANVGSDKPVPLGEVNLQYWFNGPDGVAQLEKAAPNQLFQLKCSDATTGCGTVKSNFTKGLVNTRGAMFALNLAFTPAAGQLRKINSSLIGKYTSGPNVRQPEDTTLNVMQVLVIIESRQLALVQMNQTIDYSFADTPVSQLRANLSQTVPRIPVPNWGIPAYLDNKLAWGSPPKSATVTAPTPQQPLVLPPGVTCEQTSRGSGGTQVCGVSVSYCCQGKLSPTIPKIWPPLRPADFTATGPAGPPLPTVGLPAGRSGSHRRGKIAAFVIVPVAVAAALVALLTFVFTRKRRTRRHLMKQSKASPQPSASSSGVLHSELGLSSSGTSMHAATLHSGPTLSALDHRDPHGGAGANGVWQPNWSRYHRHLDSRQAGTWDPGYGSAGISHLQSDHSHMTATSGETDNGDWSVQGFGADPHEGETGNEDVFAPASRPLLRRKSATLPVSPPHGSSSNRGSTVAADPTARGGNGLVPMRSMESKRRPFGLATSQGGNPAAGARDPPGSGDYDGSQASANGGTVDRMHDGAVPMDSRQGSGSSGAGNEPALERRHSWGGALQQWAEPEPLPVVAFQGRLIPSASLGQTFLPPLPSFTGAAPRDVDLAIVFATEIEPHLGRCLGRGGFGAVYEGQWRGQAVAVKRLPPLEGRHSDEASPEAQYSALVAETRLSARFSCSRLVAVLGASLEGPPEDVSLVMELVTGGSLADRIHDRAKRRLTYLEILQVAHDVATGLAYLHPSVVHRDLKPHNVLLEGAPQSGRAKVADFGISRVKDPTQSYLSATNNNGTPMYMAPEQFNGSHLDEKVDVYSLGCILNECWSRRRPWPNDHHFFQIILKVAMQQERPWVAPDTPPALARLIRKCWAQDPRLRLSCTEVARLSGDLIQHYLSHRAAPPRSPSLAQVPHANGGGGVSRLGVGPPQGVGRPNGIAASRLQNSNGADSSGGGGNEANDGAESGGTSASGGSTGDGLGGRGRPLAKESSLSLLLASGSGAMASSNGSGVSRGRFSGIT